MYGSRCVCMCAWQHTCTGACVHPTRCVPGACESGVVSPPQLLLDLGEGTSAEEPERKRTRAATAEESLPPDSASVRVRVAVPPHAWHLPRTILSRSPSSFRFQ